MHITINHKIYEVIKLLGKGKSGYSYLVKDEKNKEFVIKQIHHEPCDYYQFGNKLEAEIHAYQKLLKLKIPMPKLIEVDIENERILKEYIPGLTVFDMVNQNLSVSDALQQLKNICCVLYQNHLNIDYFPTNFIMYQDILYYIDYEYNQYMDEWNFENWGIKYWSKTTEFMDYIKNNKH